MRKIIKHWMTERDNQTYDLRKALWAWSVLAFSGMAFYHLYVGHPFDPIGMGTGMGAVLGGGGAAIGMTPRSETTPAP